MAVPLKRAMFAGRVVQLRYNGTYGASYWTLPDVPVEKWHAKLKPVVNPHAEFDRVVLETFRRVARTTGASSLRARDVLPHLPPRTSANAR